MDWSESLDTSFDPQDLSSDPAIIELNITAKTRQIDNLREQLSSLQHNVKGDEASLRAAMDDASDKYSEAQATLAGSYTESARLLATRIVRAAVPATAISDGITWAEGTIDSQKSSLGSMVVRIPGPQVIGYVQQMLPYDGTHPFNKDEALRPDIFLPGDEIETPRRPVERAMAPTADKKKFTIRPIKGDGYGESGESGESPASKPDRAQAPKPKQPNGSGDTNGNGDAHEHNDDEMDHAMKLIAAKLREKLAEPGFLEKLLSGQ
jgi:hypothetical protein